jgi:methylmalonyl-CoA mutase N-terminal domain/subunit
MTEPQFPFRRGYSDVPYSERPWIIGQYSGFSDPRSTNARFRATLESGGDGLSIALDLPTQWGLDPDNTLARGEIGRVGVSVASLDDLDELFAGIDLTKVRQISTTANSIGPVFIALFVALARRREIDPSTFTIRLQNDPLKEYVARGTHVLPVDAAAELAVDAIEYCARELTTWVPMSISGYHLRDAGGSRVQELGFTLCNAKEYLRRAERRGISATQVAQSVFWFLAASTAPIHEAAKFRAARELWATTLEKEFGVTDEAARRLRLIVYTLGGEMSPFEIDNNAVRITLAALGAVLGGVQTLFCSSADEALGIPSDARALLAVRTQQILLRESGLADFLDPLGGAEAVEALTDELVAEARALAAHVDELGGAASVIHSGWMRAQIDEEAWKEEIRRRESPRIGENAQTAEIQDALRILVVEQESESTRAADFAAWRARRDRARVDESLKSLRDFVAAGRNVVDPLVHALEAGVTLGEIMSTFIDVYGVAPDREMLGGARA